MKDQGDVRTPKMKFERFQSKRNEVEDRRKQSDASVYRPEQPIKQQRNNRERGDRNEPYLTKQSPSEEGLGVHRR